MSRLGNLFGGAGDADSNDALKYSAPKEPKKAAASPAPAVAAAATTAAPAAAPKMMASATVRLYKVNPATGAYEVQAGGGPLGCVIFGSGLQNQILVYNAQRAPQATVSINADFAYNIRDTYMSFVDSLKNNWSLLFDSEDVMQRFLRALVATIAHTACFSEPAGQKDQVITGALPGATSTSAAEASAEDSTPLSAGFLAGIQYSAWELCGDPSESPADAINGTPFKSVQLPDLAKVKVSVGGGSVEEPFGGLSSALLNRKKGDRFMLAIPPSILQRGTVDMRLRQRPTAWMMVEVEIMKVKDGSKEKKEKKDKPAVVVTETVAATEQHVPFGSTEASPERRNSGSLKDRMAHLSQAGGGMHMGLPQPQQQQQQQPYSSPPQQQPQSVQPQSVQQQPYQQQQQYQPPVQQVQQQQVQQQQVQQQQVQQQQFQQSQFQPPQQQQMYSGYQPQQQMYGQPQAYDNPYAVALVPGQEARSHFMGESGPSTMHNRFPVERQSLGDTSSPLLQQSMSSIQATVMQLNQKMDALLSLSGGMGMMHLQQHQGWMHGAGGYNNQGGAGSMKGRGEEVIAMVSAMVAEFDKKSNTSSDDNVLKEQISKLQDKVEALQNRNEKLMLEKSDLLDRQSNMLQTSAASSAKSYELQHEVELLRKEKANSESKLSDLLRSVETLQRQADSGGQDRSKVLDLEANLSRAEIEKRSLEQTISELRHRASSEDEKWTQRVAEQRARGDAAFIELADANRKISSLTEELSSLHARCAQAESTAAIGPGLSDDVVAQRIGDAVRDTEQRLSAQNDATIKNYKAAADKEKIELEAKVADLTGTIGNLTDELIKSASAAPATATAEVSQDQLKELVQIIYGKLHERLVPEDGEDVSYAPGDVMKHVKAVMKTAVTEHSAVSK